MVLKALSTDEITGAQMEKINACARREMSPEEVYVFSLVLCDNEVDRDGERFTLKSLEKLAGLFVGKTGVFDHSARAENQSARIFETEVEINKNRSVLGGEPCAGLKAWAYMVRCQKNVDLILEIDAGIKKEVSVGCAVDRVLCSVCGQDRKKDECPHEKGKSYNGVFCCHELVDPTDAYEWSFVAVPSQRNAGVTKGHTESAEGFGVLEAIMKSDTPVELSRGDVLALRNKLLAAGEMEKAYGGYMEALRRDMVRLGSLAQPGFEPALLEELAGMMDERQLKAYNAGCREAAEKEIPTVQLALRGPEAAAVDAQFKI